VIIIHFAPHLSLIGRCASGDSGLTTGDTVQIGDSSKRSMQHPHRQGNTASFSNEISRAALLISAIRLWPQSIEMSLLVQSKVILQLIHRVHSDSKQTHPQVRVLNSNVKTVPKNIRLVKLRDRFPDARHTCPVLKRKMGVPFLRHTLNQSLPFRLAGTILQLAALGRSSPPKGMWIDRLGFNTSDVNFFSLLLTDSDMPRITKFEAVFRGVLSANCQQRPIANARHAGFAGKIRRRRWSGRRESNPRVKLGRLPFYH
jgi:hypothetical protein